MSVYTTELRHLIKSGFDIGLKTYPIFDENYREKLNSKIIGHYYFREIGFETAELFKRYLNQTMIEIMPYYNQLYESELIKFNPLHNVDKWETANTDFDSKTDYTGNTNSATKYDGKTTTSDESTTEASQTVTAENKEVRSDTPQGLLSIGNIQNEIYASDATFTNGQSNTTGTSVTNSNGKTVVDDTTTANTDATSNTIVDNSTNFNKHVSGKEAGETYSEMLKKYRETFLNIDMMIINDLSSCFMNVY